MASCPPGCSPNPTAAIATSAIVGFLVRGPGLRYAAPVQRGPVALEVGRARYALGAAGLATGAALLVFFLAGVALWLSLGATVALAGIAARWAWTRLAPAERPEVRRRASAGLVSGVAALASYDASRFLVVRLAGTAFWPFDTLMRFGELLVGSGAPQLLVFAAGTAYHVANGLGFALAYALVLGYRGWWAGVAWALALETLMVSFYPGWLGLRALEEFLAVSLLGHLAYGAVLGWSCRALLVRHRR